MKNEKFIKRFNLALTGVLLTVFWLLAPMHSDAQQTGLTWGPFYKTDGTPITNAYSIYAWPLQNQWVQIGTNVVWEGQIFTNVPSSNGYFTNLLWPGFYAVKVPALGNNVFFFANIPTSTGFQIPIADCITNAVQFLTQSSSYSMVTNWLGFAPTTNTLAGIIGALGYQPQPGSASLTNLSAGTTIYLTNNGVISAFNYTNGVLQIYNPANGLSVLVSNFNLTISSNGVPWGNVSAGTLSGVMTTQDFTGDGTNYGGTNLTLSAIVAPGTAVKFTYDAKGRTTGTNVLTLADLPSPTNGYVLQSNVGWPPPNIPTYTGALTNYWIGSSNGYACLVWTNNGSGTLGIYFLPTP